MRNIFLEKSYPKYGGETIPRSFSKKIKIEHISGSITKSSSAAGRTRRRIGNTSICPYVRFDI